MLQTRVLINKWNSSQLRPWTYASRRLIAPARPTKLHEADTTCQNRRRFQVDNIHLIA